MKKNFIAEKSKHLKIASITVSEKLKAGIFRSIFRGSGIEFDSVREYEAGDDVRSIDWNVTARNGKAFVKMYKEDRDLTFFVCADFSNSMNAGYNGITAKEKTLETAAILSFAALNISAACGGVFFNGENKRFFPPAYSEDSILTMLKTCENFASSHNTLNGTPINNAIKTCINILRQRSLIFLISDFKVENYEKSLALLASKHNVICIKITNDLDKTIPACGTVMFSDYENDFKIPLPTSSSIFKAEREKKYIQEITHWKNNCLSCNASSLLLNINEDTIKTLNVFFSKYKTIKHNANLNRGYLL